MICTSASGQKPKHLAIVKALMQGAFRRFPVCVLELLRHPAA